MKKPTSFRLSDQALKNLEIICQISGINKTAAVEIALAGFVARVLLIAAENQTNLSAKESVVA